MSELVILGFPFNEQTPINILSNTKEHVQNRTGTLFLASVCFLIFTKETIQNGKLRSRHPHYSHLKLELP